MLSTLAAFQAVLSLCCDLMYAVALHRAGGNPQASAQEKQAALATVLLIFVIWLEQDKFAVTLPGVQKQELIGY